MESNLLRVLNGFIDLPEEQKIPAVATMIALTNHDAYVIRLFGTICCLDHQQVQCLLDYALLLQGKRVC